ncbi:lipocalin family protein [Draconibacterium sp. IB214405]|uniref:lipocalin family protein n=1 Tax=Draconibacterium sp. IB214405 TaxID=3097352 RepID=UPI002A0F6170|nr:lipocalin family protein [Draconibacterium sp. IB214405]MDX8337857.1 lipocalin family protein [Draconibacterium sp. IB214405]
MVSLLLLGFLINGLLTGCSGQQSLIDKSVVKELDLEKYLGTWYEIARYDHRFEQGLVGVTANYSIRPDGKIKVVNSGYQNTLDGEYSEAIGKAKIPDPENEPAKLKVSFFWIFYGDYYVLELDEDYQWAVIGSSSDKYLWILSRSTQMEPAIYNDLLKRIADRGYDTSALIKVKQKENN